MNLPGAVTNKTPSTEGLNDRWLLLICPGGQEVQDCMPAGWDFGEDPPPGLSLGDAVLANGRQSSGAFFSLALISATT